MIEPQSVMLRYSSLNLVNPVRHLLHRCRVPASIFFQFKYFGPLNGRNYVPAETWRLNANRGIRVHLLQTALDVGGQPNVTSAAAIVQRDLQRPAGVVLFLLQVGQYLFGDLSHLRGTHSHCKLIMNRILARFKELDKEESIHHRKFRMMEYRNTFKTILSPSQSLYSDIMCSKGWISDGRFDSAVVQEAKLVKKSKEAHSPSLTSLVTKMDCPDKAFAFSFFNQRQANQKQKSLYFCNLQTYQVLKLNGVKQIDKIFHFQSGTFRLKDTLPLFDQAPKFIVLVLSPKGAAFQLVSDDCSVQFDIFQLKIILLFVLTCYYVGKGEDSPVSKASQDFIEFQTILKPFEQIQLFFKKKGKTTVIPIEQLIKKMVGQSTKSTLQI